MVRLHNARCAGDACIVGPWKRSKRDLIGRIRAFGEPETVEHPTATTESTVAEDAKTVGDLVEALVVTDLAY